MASLCKNYLRRFTRETLVMRDFWPWHYAGLEPLNKKRRGLETQVRGSFSVVTSRRTRLKFSSRSFHLI